MLAHIAAPCILPLSLAPSPLPTADTFSPSLPPPPKLTETHPERRIQASPDAALPHGASACVARRHNSAPRKDALLSEAASHASAVTAPAAPAAPASSAAATPRVAATCSPGWCSGAHKEFGISHSFWSYGCLEVPCCTMCLDSHCVLK